jgi:transposase
MSKQIRPDYNQQLLLPPCVEDWVPADHPARFIREFVEQQDLAALGFIETAGDNGRPHYAPDVLLSVWLYGYFTKTISSRRLERACMENMALIWLTGNHAPDHNTLWRFFDANKKAIKNTFKQVVRVAQRAQLVGFILHALDGTKIKAAVSNRTALHKKDLEKMLAELDAGVDELHRMAEQQGASADDPGFRLPEEVATAERLREKVREAIAGMESVGREHLHPADAQARMMNAEGRPQFAYNAQAVADEASGLIVSADVVNNENDTQLLEPMLERVEETLGATAEDTAADGGYATAESIAAAQRAGHNVLLPVSDGSDKSKYHTYNFEYDAARGVVTCPLGREMTYERTKMNRNGKYEVRIFRCRLAKQCPNRRECSRDQRGRMIEISEHHEALRRQIERQKDKEKRQKFKKRGQIIERVFAQIKEQMGFRRFTCHGLDRAQAQWAIVCAAYNLMKMHRLWAEEKLRTA